MAFMMNVKNYGNGLKALAALVRDFQDGTAVLTGGTSEYALTPAAKDFAVANEGKTVVIALDPEKIESKGSVSLGAYRADGTFGDWTGLPSINIPVLVDGKSTPLNVDGQTLLELLHSDNGTCPVVFRWATKAGAQVLDKSGNPIIQANFDGNTRRWDVKTEAGKAAKDAFFSELVEKMKTKYPAVAAMFEPQPAP